MRVLHIGLSSVKGGIESFALNYATVLRERDILFDFVDIYGAGLAIEADIRSLGGRIYTLPNYKKHYTKARKQLTRILCEGGYLCVHIHMLSAASLMAVEACRAAGVVPIIHSHNSGTRGMMRRAFHAVNSGRLKHEAAVRLSCSQLAGDWMFRGQAYTVIPNAIDMEHFAYSEEANQQIRGKLGIARDALVLGFVGRLAAQKNPLFLVDVFASVHRKCPHAKLLVVGDGEWKGAMQDRARKAGVPEDIFFVGAQADPAPWYSAMDVFLLPSLFEGLAIVLPEAQAAGVACFVSERVANEGKLTPLVSTLSLSESADVWSEKILHDGHRGTDRTGYLPALRASAFSIDTSAGLLESIYRKQESHV